MGFFDSTDASQGQIVNETAKSYVDLSGIGENTGFSGTFVLGSVSGTGAIYLGSTNLEVGSLNLNTTFSGVIADQGDGS